MQKSKIYLLAIFLGAVVLATPRFSTAQVFRPGPQVATFYSEIDDSEQPFGLYIPQNYDPQKKYPLVVMLHGAMSNHRLALKRVFGKSNLPGENDALASRYFPRWKEEEYIVATPWARGTMGYTGIPEEDVMAVIESCKAHLHIDEERLFLTGLSMGGGGTLYIGLSRPGLFAAIAPVCPAPPEEAYGLMGNALNLPVAIYQGGADPVVRPEGVRLIAGDLLREGASVEYHEFPGVGHDVWVQAYENGNIFRWFDGLKRNAFPPRVKYTTRWYKYNTAYWVLFDKITPGTPATIDARFTAPNTLDIKTNDLEAFTLALKGHPSFSDSEALMVKINGIPVQSAPKMNHSFQLKEGRWISGKYHSPVVAKKKGMEGALYSALTGRVIFVYGTAGTPDGNALAARRQLAREAADFSVAFGSYEQPSLVNPRIVADREVTAEDLRSSHLFLFGTRETNQVIARMADRLPLHLKEGDTVHGLVYTYPVNGKMVVVASGVPFWKAKATPSPTPADPVSARARTRISFGTGPGAKSLAGRMDFLLFTEEGEVISEGYFDHDWQLPAEARQKLSICLP
ncbi:MAG: phospholipase [Bacteroidales bacterium]|nr:phospholipase [Bacteroidales bacterium]